MALIFLNIIVPIFVLIGVGTAMDRLFRLDLPTLSKLNFYVFVPALVFVKVLKADLQASEMWRVVAFSLAHFAALWLLAAVALARGPLRRERTVLTLGALFSNCGNYGIPLVALAFGDRCMGALAIVLMLQNLLSFTVGVWMCERHSRGALKSLAGFWKIPVVCAVVIALAMRWLHSPLPPQLEQPLDYLADGLVPVALLTLGAQLSRSAISGNRLALAAAVGMRLAISPLAAALLVPLFGLKPPLSSLMIVLAGVPVAVNVYILAAEYKQDEQLASQSVFWTTLLSAATVSILLGIVPR